MAHVVRDDGYIAYRKSRHGKYIFMSPDAYLRDKLRMVYINCKRNAEKQGLPFNIDVDYLVSIFPKDMICPVSGVVLDWGSGSPRDISPSLDKVIPESGYVKGNVVFVSVKVNRAKQDSSIEFLEQIISFYADFIEKNGISTAKNIS